MVMRWGMSESLGPIAFGDHDEQIFLGREIATRKDYSEQTAREIDDEVKSIIKECYDKARSILTEHSDELHRVAEALLERESLDGDEIKILLNNGTLPPFKKNAKKPADPPAEPPAEETPAEEDEGPLEEEE